MKVRYNLALLLARRPLSSLFSGATKQGPLPGDRDGPKFQTEKFVIERWGQYFTGIVAMTPYLLCIVKTSRAKR